jgi:hypothetical protein
MCTSRTTKTVQQRLLALRATDRANEAAATALQLFYQLAEAGRQEEYLHESLLVVEEMQTNLRKLRDRHLEVNLEPAELERQRLGIRESQIALRSSVVQAEAQLSTLLGQSVLLEEIDSDADLSGAIPSQLSADHTIPVSWQARAELQIVSLLLGNLESGTLPMARGVLQQHDAALGTVTKNAGVLALLPIPFNGAELHVRRNQLACLLQSRKQQIAAEIRTLIESMNEDVLTWNNANDVVAARREQLENLIKRRDIDETITAFDVSQARMHLIKAGSDVAQHYYRWKRAQVDVWKAVGTSASGCGAACRWLHWRPEEHTFAEANPAERVIEMGPVDAPPASDEP